MITHMDFLKAWLGAKNPHEVAAATGIDTHRIASIAASWRKQGVELPMFPKHKLKGVEPSTIFAGKLDVSALNKFIHERC